MPSFLFNNGTFYSDGSLTPQTATPTAGTTVSMSGPSIYMTPAGTLATLTLKLPPGKVGMTTNIMSSAAVTTLTMQTSLGTAVTGAPTALVANTRVTMQCINSTGSATSWIWVH